MRVEHVYAHGRVALNVFWCAHEAEAPRALEVDEFAWVTPAQLRGYRFPEANDAILERVITALTTTTARITPVSTQCCNAAVIAAETIRT